MNYVALIDGTLRELSVEALDGERYRVVLDGQEHQVDLGACGAPQGAWDPVLHLRLGQHLWRVDVDGSLDSEPGSITLWIAGQAVPLQVLSPRALQAKAAAAELAQSGPAPVAAPMAGKVVSILVNEGDAVAAGQGLLVVEAMKMENELCAPQAGTVRDLRAAVGGAVKSGAVICTVA